MRPPAEFGAQLGRVDGIAQIVPCAVGDMVKRVGGLAHQGQDHFDDGFIVLFTVGTDEVRLTDATLFQDRQDSR